MPLKGKGFMIIWHDVGADTEPDYHLWHTREHMPERLGVPGFLRGRRGVGRSLAKYRYLTLYEGETLATFGSPAYLERLNNPTAWTRKTQPAFANVTRSACEIAATVGRGVGGALATIRIPFDGIDARGLGAVAPALADELLALDGVCAVHVGIARPEVTSAKTRESALRGPAGDAVFDAVVVIDAVGRGELERIMPEIKNRLEARGLTVDPAEAAVYDMAYCLEPTG